MKPCVLVIDVQNKLFNTTPPPYEADDVIHRINHVTARARSAGVPVIFVQHEVPGYLEPDTDAWQLHPALEVTDSDIRVRKTTGDAFLHSKLQDTLTKLGVDNLIICGFATEFCVDNTTRRANGLGYTIQLVADAHTTVDKPHLSAEQIRQHHNITLSFAPTITAPLASETNFGTGQ